MVRVLGLLANDLAVLQLKAIIRAEIDACFKGPHILPASSYAHQMMCSDATPQRTWVLKAKKL